MRKLSVKKVVCLVSAVVMAAGLSACGGAKNKNTGLAKNEEAVKELPFFSEIESDDLVVLFTTDVHSKMTDYFGYDGLVSVKNKVLNTISQDNLIMADCGDCLNGSELGEQTKGQGIAQIMDYVGIDVAVLGNNDFAYGVDSVKKIADSSKFKYLCCNLREISSGENVLDSYAILEKADKKIGIVGITTPNGAHSYEGCNDFLGFILSEERDAKPVYDFSEDVFYEKIQKTVDEVRSEGVDYVILITHLGRDSEEYGSLEVIKNTTGVDAVIDGHEHIEIEMETHENAEGKDVVLTSAGEYMGAVGKLVINSEGEISSSLLHLCDYLEKDAKTTEFINQLKQ